MIEIVEFAIAFWKKSKEDWENNKHRIFALFGFMLVVFLILEFGSYVFTKKLNEAKRIELIQTKFMDKRVELADMAARKLMFLFETTHYFLKEAAQDKYSLEICAALSKKYKLEQIEADLYISFANLRYFFGDEIADEFVSLAEWFDLYNNTCFKDIPNAKMQLEVRIRSIRKKMWEKMYPQEFIKGIT